jgi:hypothetical protein
MNVLPSVDSLRFWEVDLIVTVYTMERMKVRQRRGPGKQEKELSRGPSTAHKVASLTHWRVVPA